MTEILCPHACPDNAYTGHKIRSDAQTGIVGPNFPPESFQGRKVGCQMKVFNDDQDLPIEYIPILGFRDITCVGPNDDRCPLRRGFRKVPVITPGGTRIETPRKV